MYVYFYKTQALFRQGINLIHRTLFQVKHIVVRYGDGKILPEIEPFSYMDFLPFVISNRKTDQMTGSSWFSFFQKGGE